MDRRDLSFEQSQQAMTEIMTGQATQAQIGAFLTSLRMKGETVEEITAFASVMREHSVRIHPKVKGRMVDTCGTGGDQVKTFNVSTTSVFVVAGAGVPVAKHGNRSVTSSCGSADVLEALGLNLNTPPELVEKAIENVGVGFMFAPAFHPAMKHAVGPRKEIGIRTIFNILGPLTNPAQAKAQVLGVYDANLVEPLAKVLQKLGSEEAMVVHGMDGLDEISTIGKTKVAWLKQNQVTTKEITPQDLKLRTARPSEISGFDPENSAEAVFKILNGFEDDDPARFQIVLANAAAAIVVSGKADDLESGVDVARDSISSGRAYDKLRQLVQFTGGELEKLEKLESRNA